MYFHAATNSTVWERPTEEMAPDVADVRPLSIAPRLDLWPTVVAGSGPVSAVLRRQHHHSIVVRDPHNMRAQVLRTGAMLEDGHVSNAFGAVRCGAVHQVRARLRARAP